MEGGKVYWSTWLKLRTDLARLPISFPDGDQYGGLERGLDVDQIEWILDQMRCTIMPYLKIEE